VIEGFPRSANSFAVLAFQITNPNIQIAHHLHVPAQIFRAARWKIATLVLIRNPKDAVSSLFLRNPEQSVLRALKSYILFYQSIQSYRDSYIVGAFEDVIQDYSKIIKQVNLKFKTQFLLPSLSDIEKDIVFKKIQEIEKLSSGNNPIKMAVPNSEKEPLKKKIFQELESKHSKFLIYAENIYNQFIKETDFKLE
jgi:hypothetical protein